MFYTMLGPAPWSGTSCNTVDCTKNDPDPCTVINVASDCDSAVKSLCPITCGTLKHII